MSLSKQTPLSEATVRGPAWGRGCSEARGRLRPPGPPCHPTSCLEDAGPSLLAVTSLGSGNGVWDQDKQRDWWPLRVEPPALVGKEQSPGAWEPGQDPGWAFLLLGQALSLQTPWTEDWGRRVEWGRHSVFSVSYGEWQGGGQPQVAESLPQAWEPRAPRRWVGQGTPLQTHQGGIEEKSLALLSPQRVWAWRGMRGMWDAGCGSAPSPLWVLPGQVPPLPHSSGGPGNPGM